MKQFINLSLNYPVLSNQNIYFEKSFKQHFNNYTNWLSIKPTAGDDADREIAAIWLSKGSENIDYKRISIVTGGHHAILVSILASNLQGKTVAVDEFTYSNFKELARLMNIKLISCEADEKGMMPSALKEASKKFAIKSIYLMPTVHNPTGSVMPVERRLEIIEVANSFGQTIIEDDAYGFLEANPPLKFVQLAPEISWYIYSLSKPLAPDIKVAYIISPLNYISPINAAIKITTSNPSTFFSSYISEIINSGELEIIIHEKREEGRKRQLIIPELLPGLKIMAHVNGLHIWVELPQGVNGDKLNSALLNEGVTISPSSLFRSSPKGNKNDSIRIALGGEQDINKLIQGIEIVKYHIFS